MVPGLRSALEPDPMHKCPKDPIQNIAEQTAGGIQDQVIHIKTAQIETKLERFDQQTEQRRDHDADKNVRFLRNRAQKCAERHEQKHISEDIQEHSAISNDVAVLPEAQDLFKWFQVIPRRVRRSICHTLTETSQIDDQSQIQQKQKNEDPLLFFR
jgi:hypothetical protein